MDSKLKVKKDYDSSAPFYEKRYRNIQWRKYKKMIDIPIKGKILDLGCGTGLLSEFLQKEIVGVDISFQMLQQAKSRECVVQADMDVLPFHSAVFDAVFSFTSLQNLPSVNYVFGEVRRVLKKNRPFLFTMLKKKFSSSVAEKVEYHFEIIQKRECGEDIGFICW